MNTSQNYGMLYEVLKDFIDRTFRRMQVARDDQGKYEYFLKKGLLEKISEFDLAEKKKKKKRFLWHDGRKVNLEKLDILLSLHIITILEGESKKKKKKWRK